jgi:hypothetical protein
LLRSNPALAGRNLGPTSSAGASSASATSAATIEGDPDSFTARYRNPHGDLMAVLAANRPRDVGPLRRELAGEAMPAAA